MCLGIPGRIVALDDPEAMLATVDVCGVRRQINLICVVDDDHPFEACLGDWVLVHVGFAMSRIDAEEAEKTLQLLEELGEQQAELEAMADAADAAAAD
ncbi:MAG: HypC/HybG/HupF family hydrogenase formation chaperone [Thiohalocapsa sp.]